MKVKGEMVCWLNLREVATIEIESDLDLVMEEYKIQLTKYDAVTLTLMRVG